VRRFLFLALVPLLMLAGVCAYAERTDEPTRVGKPRVYGLYSQNKSGEFGTVTLTPIIGARTEVDIALVAAPPDTLQPVNIYMGTCAKLNPHPKYALNYAVGGISQTLLPVQLVTLIAGGLAVNVHKSISDVETYVSCGNL
jgi:hypothetical protein